MIHHSNLDIGILCLYRCPCLHSNCGIGWLADDRTVLFRGTRLRSCPCTPHHRPDGSWHRRRRQHLRQHRLLRRYRASLHRHHHSQQPTANGIINNEISASRMGHPRERVYAIRGGSFKLAVSRRRLNSCRWYRTIRLPSSGQPGRRPGSGRAKRSAGLRRSCRCT